MQARNKLLARRRCETTCVAFFAFIPGGRAQHSFVCGGLVKDRKASRKRAAPQCKSRFVEMFNEVKQTSILEELIDPETRISYGIVQPGPEGTGDMGVLRPVDIADGRLCLDAVKKIDRAIGNSYRRTELMGDEILTIVRGATGQTVRSKVDCAGMNVTRGIAVIRHEPSLINPDYLVGYMNSDNGKRYIADHTQGATLQQINIADLRVMPIPVPPLALQQEFAAFVSQVDKLRFDEGVKSNELVVGSFDLRCDAIKLIHDCLLLAFRIDCNGEIA